VDNTREVYSMCLKLIPHKKFTFAKIWLLFAKFEIRQKNITSARRILVNSFTLIKIESKIIIFNCFNHFLKGQSIGMCPKDKLFKGYIELEIELREFDRCRLLYEKYLEFNPQNCTTWIKYGELESILGDNDRARAIYELSIEQPCLDMPEIIWKAYIDFEIEQQEYDKVRELYKKLLSRTQHVKVWLSFAQFEVNIAENDNYDKARAIYKKSYNELKNISTKESRLMVLEAWKEFEVNVSLYSIIINLF
jgi:crooked neck